MVLIILLNKKIGINLKKNNKNVALNILSAHFTKKKINIVKTSKHNNTRTHKVILLIISDKDNNWHYICV